jgi:hypothetical protein
MARMRHSLYRPQGAHAPQLVSPRREDAFQSDLVRRFCGCAAWFARAGLRV